MKYTVAKKVLLKLCSARKERQRGRESWATGGVCPASCLRFVTIIVTAGNASRRRWWVVDGDGPVMVMVNGGL